MIKQPIKNAKNYDKKKRNNNFSIGSNFIIQSGQRKDSTSIFVSKITLGHINSDF